jgi:hypothetical protein
MAPTLPLGIVIMFDVLFLKTQNMPAVAVPLNEIALTGVVDVML